jgi:hypothetical protein
MDIFIGYAEGVKAYRILDLVTRRVRTVWDVIFNEGRGWDWSKETNDNATALSSEFTVEYAELEGFGGAGDSIGIWLTHPCSQDAFTNARLHSTRCTDNFSGTRWLMCTRLCLTLGG